MSTAAALLDIEKASGTTWHSALLCKLPELKLSIILINLISVEGEMSTPRDIQAGVPQSSVFSTAFTVFNVTCSGLA
jgi:hypothetical protein